MAEIENVDATILNLNNSNCIKNFYMHQRSKVMSIFSVLLSIIAIELANIGFCMGLVINLVQFSYYYSDFGPSGYYSTSYIPCQCCDKIMNSICTFLLTFPSSYQNQYEYMTVYTLSF